MGKLVYAATPFRLEHKTKEICDYIEQQGFFPVHPLLALPYERYNYERHSREDIFRVCFGLVDLCDAVWIFGIGSGSLKEYLRKKQFGGETRSLVKLFDPDWEIWAKKEKYQTNFGTVLEEVLRLSILPK